MALLAKYSLKVAPSSILLPMLLKHEPDSRLTSARSFLFTGNKQYTRADPVPANWASSPFFGAPPLLIRTIHISQKQALALFCCFCLECLLFINSQIQIVFQIPQSISSTKKHFNKWCWEKWISTCRGMKLDRYFSACTKTHPKLTKAFRQIQASTFCGC